MLFCLGLGSGGYLALLELGGERQFDGVEGVERGQSLGVVCERDGLGGRRKLRHALLLLFVSERVRLGFSSLSALLSASRFRRDLGQISQI
jgi:hypothetical protein